MAAVFTILIGETSAMRLASYFLYQTIFEFSRPFSLKECLDRMAAADELRLISPIAVGRVGECHPGGIPAVPGVFSRPSFLCGSMVVERRNAVVGSSSY